MRYLLLLLILSILSCDKDNDTVKPQVDPPTVVNVVASSEMVNGTNRPKFTITLNVPDSMAVATLNLYQNARFPISQSGVINNPKSGVYTVIDNTQTYPPATAVKYFAYFTMKDFSFLSYYPFEVK